MKPRPKPSKADIFHWMKAECGEYFFEHLFGLFQTKPPYWLPDSKEQAWHEAGKQEVIQTIKQWLETGNGL